MKFQYLIRGQFFRVGKQRNYRRFLSCETLPNDESIPEQHRGKLLVSFDNCKQMICHPDIEVDTKDNLFEPIKGYNKYYSTGNRSLPVTIDGFKTKITYFLKGGIRLVYVYAIMNKKGEYIDLDTRNIEGFPDVDYQTMSNDGITILKDNIMQNPSPYKKLIENA